MNKHYFPCGIRRDAEYGKQVRLKYELSEPLRGIFQPRTLNILLNLDDRTRSNCTARNNPEFPVLCGFKRKVLSLVWIVSCQSGKGSVNHYLEELKYECQDNRERGTCSKQRVTFPKRVCEISY